MLEQGEVLTLNDNKKYSVVFSCIYNQKNYVYLIEQNDYTNTMFCEYDNNNGLKEVLDTNIIEELMIIYTRSQEK